MEKNTPEIVSHAYREVIQHYKLNRSRVDLAVSVIVGLLLWQLIGQSTPDIIFVGIGETFSSWVDLIQSGEYLTDLVASGKAFLVGYIIAIILGLAIGLVLVLSDPISAVVGPWIDALYSTPRLAIAPLILVWLGIGFKSKVFIIVLTAIFPMIINTQTGFENVDQSLQQVADSFGASQLRIFRTVLLPGALPYIIAGARLATVRAIIGVVVAEFLGARAGIGYLIFQSSGQFNIGDMLVGIITVAFAGMALVRLVYVIQHRVAPWTDYVDMEGM